MRCVTPAASASAKRRAGCFSGCFWCCKSAGGAAVHSLYRLTASPNTHALARHARLCCQLNSHAQPTRPNPCCHPALKLQPAALAALLLLLLCVAAAAEPPPLQAPCSWDSCPSAARSSPPSTCACGGSHHSQQRRVQRVALQHSASLAGSTRHRTKQTAEPDSSSRVSLCVCTQRHKASPPAHATHATHSLEVQAVCAAQHQQPTVLPLLRRPQRCDVLAADHTRLWRVPPCRR
jgi:hypothetical protein